MASSKVLGFGSCTTAQTSLPAGTKDCQYSDSQLSYLWLECHSPRQNILIMYACRLKGESQVCSMYTVSSVAARRGAWTQQPWSSPTGMRVSTRCDGRCEDREQDKTTRQRCRSCIKCDKIDKHARTRVGEQCLAYIRCTMTHDA